MPTQPVNSVQRNRFELGIDPTRQPDVSFIDPTCQRLDSQNEDGSITASDPFALPAHLRGAGFQHNTSLDLQFGVALDPATPTNWINGGQTGQVPFPNLTAGLYNVQMCIQANTIICNSENQQQVLTNQTTVRASIRVNTGGGQFLIQNIAGEPPFDVSVFDGNDDLVATGNQFTITGGTVGNSLPIGTYTVIITDAGGCIFVTPQLMDSINGFSPKRPSQQRNRILPPVPQHAEVCGIGYSFCKAAKPLLTACTPTPPVVWLRSSSIHQLVLAKFLKCMT